MVLPYAKRVMCLIIAERRKDIMVLPYAKRVMCRMW